MTPKTTLDEVMRRELGPEQTVLDAVVVFGPLRFRIQRLSETGTIELVGMAILSESEETASEAERPEDGIG